MPSRPAARRLESVLGRVQRRFELEYDRDHGGRREWYTLSAEALERSAGGAVVTRANVTARRQALEIEEQRRELSHLARVAVLGPAVRRAGARARPAADVILSNAQAAATSCAAGLRRRRAGRHSAGHHRRGPARRQVIDRLRALLKRGEARLQPVEPGELIATCWSWPTPS